MFDVIGIDSRLFRRGKNNSEYSFESVLGVAVRTRNYEEFDKKYSEAIEFALVNNGHKREYIYYCYNDLKNLKNKWKVLEDFFLKIKDYIFKLHIFFNLFSPKKIPEVKVYGRYARRKKIKLSKDTMTIKEFVSRYLINVFPGLCAWKMMPYLSAGKTQFHMDSFDGHISEAQEEFASSNFDKFVYTHGDCVNPVISCADLLIALIDYRLSKKKLHLYPDNIKTIFSDFEKERLAIFTFDNRSFRKITPIDKISIDNTKNFKRPIYWLFKGNLPLVDTGDITRSENFRKFLDFIASRGGCAKFYNNKTSRDLIDDNDKAIALNELGEEVIRTLNRTGKKLEKINFDLFLEDSDRAFLD